MANLPPGRRHGSERRELPWVGSVLHPEHRCFGLQRSNIEELLRLRDVYSFSGRSDDRQVSHNDWHAALCYCTRRTLGTATGGENLSRVLPRGRLLHIDIRQVASRVPQARLFAQQSRFWPLLWLPGPIRWLLEPWTAHAGPQLFQGFFCSIVIF